MSLFEIRLRTEPRYVSRTAHILCRTAMRFKVPRAWLDSAQTARNTKVGSDTWYVTISSGPHLSREGSFSMAWLTLSQPVSTEYHDGFYMRTSRDRMDFTFLIRYVI